MRKLRLPYLEHIIRRQGSLEKTPMLGNTEAAGKEEDPLQDELTP